MSRVTNKSPANIHHRASPDLLVFASFSGQGGVERLLARLVGSFADSGLRVELLMIKDSSSYVEEIPGHVTRRRVRLGHNATSVPELALYLRRRRPRAVLAVKDRAIRAAVRARRLAGVDVRLVGALHTTLLAALADKSALSRWFRTAPMTRLYRHVDAVIAVSEGVAEDTRAVTGLPAERIHVIGNPVITPDLDRLAREAVSHPWLAAQGGTPVLVASGRMTRQKDFSTLLRAFARVRRARAARLLILGEGEQRQALEALARELDIASDVDMVGFVSNPYPYVRQADLFVLSSRWEGLPTVLIEALALGVPAVSTDCPSGPREILAEGRYGALVPVGDDEALAQVMQAALDTHPEADTLKAAMRRFELGASTRQYLDVLGLQKASN